MAGQYNDLLDRIVRTLKEDVEAAIVAAEAAIDVYEPEDGLGGITTAKAALLDYLRKRDAGFPEPFVGADLAVFDLSDTIARLAREYEIEHQVIDPEDLPDDDE
jgi:hypothetical protein